MRLSRTSRDNQTTMSSNSPAPEPTSAAVRLTNLKSPFVFSNSSKPVGAGLALPEVAFIAPYPFGP
jgi:hypothetical protein